MHISKVIQICTVVFQEVDIKYHWKIGAINNTLGFQALLL